MAFLTTYRWFPLSVLFVVSLTYLMYSPGLNGGFLFDDSFNITLNKALHADQLDLNQIKAATFSSDAGPLKRPVAMFSFALNHISTGLDPYYFKLTNLAIHLLTGLSLILLTVLLLQSYNLKLRLPLKERQILLISLAVAAAWLLHPFNLTSVLYIVQRMNSLAMLFTVWGLIFYIWGRRQQLSDKHGAAHILIGISLFGALAAFSKENGVLLPVYIFLIEWLILGFCAPKQKTRIFLYSFATITVLLPATALIFYLIINPEWWLNGYNYRDFSLMQRILTEGRVLWFYINMILVPDITRMGLYHDDIQLSEHFLSPYTTLPALIGIAAVIISAIAIRKIAPLLAFGTLFFFACHSMESTVFALEIAHEHRNYLASYGLLLPVFYYLLYAAKNGSVTKLRHGLAGAIIAVLTINTAVRAENWSNHVDLALVNVEHHPDSARSNIYAGKVYFELAAMTDNETHHLALARHHFEQAAATENYNLAGRFALLVLDDREGKPVDKKQLTELAQRLREDTLSPATVNSLILLNQCKQRGPCALPPVALNVLFRAILENPTLRAVQKAHVLTEITQHLVTLGNIEGAIYFAEQAVKNDPKSPQTHLNYANLLIATKKYQIASKQIELAKQQDTYNHFAKRIDQQQQLLEQAITSK